MKTGRCPELVQVHCWNVMVFMSQCTMIDLHLTRKSLKSIIDAGEIEGEKVTEYVVTAHVGVQRLIFVVDPEQIMYRLRADEEFNATFNRGSLFLY